MSGIYNEGKGDESRITQIAEQNGADLARANLLRMRSEYRGAIDQCLSLLKRSPEDPDAHTLIGDIYAEQGDLGQAAQWYELALDLNPASTQDQQKLQYVQQRIKEREAATASQQIAVPSASPHTWLPWAVMGAVAIIIGIGAYLAGQRQDVKKPVSRANIPVSAPLTPSDSQGSENPETVNPAPGPAEEDRHLAASLGGQIPAGITLLSAWQDPRNRDIILTIRIRPDDSERVVAAEIGRSVLKQMAGAGSVTIRAEKNSQITHIAVVDRARVAVTETSGWAEAHTGGEALADALLAQEWPEHTSSVTPPVANGDSTPPGSTAGSDIGTTGANQNQQTP